jgi:glycogen(starch) synthase
MRILFWSELFCPYVGGAEVFGAQLVRALRARGHEMVVVTSHDYLGLPSQAEYHGIPVHRFPFRTAMRSGDAGLLLEARRQLVDLKRRFKPDVVHVNGVNPSVLLHLQTEEAHRARALVRVNTELGPGLGAGPQTLMRHALRAADWVTCVSAAVMRQVQQWMPEVGARSSVIYSGLDLSSQPPAPLPFREPVVLCLGRLVPAKGFDLVLTAFASVRQRCPHARLVMAGDGAARPDLERQAAELRLDGAVEFLGWVRPQSVPALLETATVVLMPSRREGLPLVALQAARAGRPIVAARVGGLPEIVKHEQTGLLVPPEDSRALGEALATLLDQPEMASRMGRAAYQRFQAVFDWNQCVAAYDGLYRRLIERADSPAGPAVTA